MDLKSSKLVFLESATHSLENLKNHNLENFQMHKTQIPQIKQIWFWMADHKLLEATICSNAKDFQISRINFKLAYKISTTFPVLPLHVHTVVCSFKTFAWNQIQIPLGRLFCTI